MAVLCSAGTNITKQQQQQTVVVCVVCVGDRFVCVLFWVCFCEIQNNAQQHKLTRFICLLNMFLFTEHVFVGVGGGMHILDKQRGQDKLGNDPKRP